MDSMTTLCELMDSDSCIIPTEDNIGQGKSDSCMTGMGESEVLDSRIISPENNMDQANQGKSDTCTTTLCELIDSDSCIISTEDNIEQGKSDSCMTSTAELKDSDSCIILNEDNIDQEKSDSCMTLGELEKSESCIISHEDNTHQGKLDVCMTTSIKLEDSDSGTIYPEDNTDQDSKENIDAYIDTNSIWKCMKRINSNLDFLSQKLNVVQSDQVQVQTQKAQSSTLDDFDFLLLFPLKKIEEVIELESRLMDNTSHFYKKFISFITPEDNKKNVLDLKNFVRTILRTLFTYSLTSNYSWRGFRGNFQIGNLKTIKIIFDISKSKYKNVSKQCVNSFIKEWIRYAKQRHKQLKKNNDS